MLAYDVRRKQSERSGRSGKSMTSGKSTMSGLSGSAGKRTAAAPDARAALLSWIHACSGNDSEIAWEKMLLVGRPKLAGHQIQLLRNLTPQLAELAPTATYI